MFSDKNDIDYEKNSAIYLLSRTYIFDKTINKKNDNSHNFITIGHDDISFNCPLYYLSLYYNNRDKINESLYTVIMIFSEQCKLDVNFKNGYISNDKQFLFNIWGKNQIKSYKHIVGEQQCLYNGYTDKILIKFNKDMNFDNLDKIKTECKVYDLYLYSEFFRSGWLYC